MAGSFSGNTGVWNINGMVIVFINCSRILLGKTNFPKHILQEPISLGNSHTIKKIWFRGTQLIDQMIFIPINNCTPGKCNRKYSSGSTLGRLIFVYSTHKHISSPLSMSCLNLGYFCPIQSDGIWFLEDPVGVLLFCI